MTGRIRCYITISNFLPLKLENAITAKLELCVALVQTESNRFQKWAEHMCTAGNRFEERVTTSLRLPDEINVS